jgi:hypothetical protein
MIIRQLRQSITASSTLSNSNKLATPESMANEQGFSPPLDLLAQQTLRMYPFCGIKQWQKEEKSSSLKLNATNPILRPMERCEARTFAASQESSPAPSGPAAESSSRSLNPANREINQIFHTKRWSKIEVASSNKLR